MSEDDTISLMLVDDHPLVRDGIKARLAAHVQIKVVGEAEEGGEALRKIGDLQPDIVFMDIGLPGMNGLDVTRHLHSEFPDIRVIVLTVYDNKEYAVQALRAGARGYLLKNAPSTELIRALEQVQKGELFFSTDIAQKVMQEYLQEATHPQKPELTRREREVLGMIAEGLSNKEVADKLSISVRTVETHRQNIMGKLEIHTVAGLTRYAIENQLVPLK